ncbi:MAG TPA: enoyl-CoA hydratase-related protein, partial [Hyphomicrobiaceae bacterium]|nr:enoyl-CoA hydratase-related protein [Hyphomicrobiaceae bacterium]
MAVKQAERRRSQAAARTSDLEVARRGGIAVLTLARPDRRNSLSESMLGALQQAIDDASQDDGVRVVVIAAKGSVFSAGHDLKEFTAHRGDPDGGRAYHGKLMR